MTVPWEKPAPVFCPTCRRMYDWGSGRVRWELTDKGRLAVLQIRAAKRAATAQR